MINTSIIDLDRSIRLSPIKKQSHFGVTPISGKISIKAEIDLLLGKKQSVNKNLINLKDMQKQDVPESKEVKSGGLLSKISNALKNNNLNIFTKEALFEEVETEEFDNPKHRDYMEDRVLTEFLTTPLESQNNEGEKDLNKDNAEKVIESSIFGAPHITKLPP